MANDAISGGAKKSSRAKSPARKTTRAKSPAKKSTRGKKGGADFLGAVSELFVPAGWENFATAAGLMAKKKSSRGRKQAGGMEDGHHTIEEMDAMMKEHVAAEDPIEMEGGAKKKGKGRAKTPAKKAAKKPAKKSRAKK